MQIVDINKKIKMIVCKKCGQSKKYHAKNMCMLCYNYLRKVRNSDKKDFQLM